MNTGEKPVYFYMRVLYTFGDGQLRTFGDQRGSVTRDPLAAFKRYQLAFEQKVQTCGMSRAGRLFATWQLPSKMSRDRAQAYARTVRPHRVHIVVAPYGWGSVQMVLPEDQEILIEDYREKIAAWKKEKEERSEES